MSKWLYAIPVVVCFLVGSVLYLIQTPYLFQVDSHSLKDDAISQIHRVKRGGKHPNRGSNEYNNYDCGGFSDQECYFECTKQLSFGDSQCLRKSCFCYSVYVEEYGNKEPFIVHREQPLYKRPQPKHKPVHDSPKHESNHGQETVNSDHKAPSHHEEHKSANAEKNPYIGHNNYNTKTATSKPMPTYRTTTKKATVKVSSVTTKRMKTATTKKLYNNPTTIKISETNAYIPKNTQNRTQNASTLAKAKDSHKHEG